MKAVEARRASVNNAYPLRSEIIPKHLLLGTVSLINLCFTSEQGKRGDYTMKRNLVKHHAKIWGFFFKTDMKCFHMEDDTHAHTFDHQIETDGVSCSILVKRKDMVGKRIKEPKPKKGNSEIYIDEV
eukprot:jgi/Pico_ML_1/54193/g4604.t1